MEDRVAFGPWQPDVPLLVNLGLVTARNTVPVRGGYDGMRKAAALAGFGTLAERVRGSIAGICPAGTPYNFAGTQTKLYALRDERGVEDVSRTTGGAYNCGDDAIWEAAVFAKGGCHTVIFCNLGDETQYFSVGVSTAFQRLGNPETTNTKAPRAARIGIIGSFIVLGDTFDSVNGRDETAIHWSALNDPFNWPPIGSETAIAVQSGRQPLGGDGGAVQRIVSGGEVAAVFQERKVWRADYRGGDVVFQLSPVEPNRGLLVPQIAVPFGRRVFYCSEDGFYLFDYTESVPIGREVVDKAFLSDIDSSYFHRASAVKDPDSQRIWVAYPGAGNSSGTPNKLLVYDFGLNRFSHGEVGDVEWLSWVTDAGVTIDSPGIIGDPDAIGDDPAYPDGGIDSAGLPNFDVRITPFGGLKLGSYSPTHQIQDFSGAWRASMLETGRRELVPGSRSQVRSVRPLVDGADPSVQVRGVSRTNEVGEWTPPSTVNDSGDCPLRKDARYHQFRVNLPAGFRAAVGLDVVFGQTGGR